MRKSRGTAGLYASLVILIKRVSISLSFFNDYILIFSIWNGGELRNIYIT